MESDGRESHHLKKLRRELSSMHNFMDERMSLMSKEISEISKRVEGIVPEDKCCCNDNVTELMAKNNIELSNVKGALNTLISKIEEISEEIVEIDSSRILTVEDPLVIIEEKLDNLSFNFGDATEQLKRIEAKIEMIHGDLHVLKLSQFNIKSVMADTCVSVENVEETIGEKIISPQLMTDLTKNINLAVNRLGVVTDGFSEEVDHQEHIRRREMENLRDMFVKEFQTLRNGIRSDFNEIINNMVWVDDSEPQGVIETLKNYIMPDIEYDGFV